MDKNTSPEQAERARRAQDRILVHNPTDQDFLEEWNRSQTNGEPYVRYVIPAAHKDGGRGLGNAIVPRFIAEKYIIDMCDHIINRDLYDAIQAENKNRTDAGQAPLKKYDSADGNDELGFARQYMADKNEKMKEIIVQLWVRVDEEYGMNTPELPNAEQAEAKDPYEFMYSVLDKKVTETPKVEQTVSEVMPEATMAPEQLEQAKDNLVAQVS